MYLPTYLLYLHTPRSEESKLEEYIKSIADAGVKVGREGCW
jgi:hypothetical protein